MPVSFIYENPLPAGFRWYASVIPVPAFKLYPAFQAYVKINPYFCNQFLYQ